ncbi:TPA: hypothetical protein JG914_004682 [Enterobacter hormaechei subsp. steigerwaltii]|nr:hypothetical protein [Enterobacter hormaechei subsp. steigerwaltii]
MLYTMHPEARSNIQHSEGYAVFSSISSKIFLLGLGSGYGIVKDQESGIDTYMKMAQGSAGIGVGVKEIDTVMVFHNRKILNNFITNGYVVGANVTAAAKYHGEGGDLGTTIKGVTQNSEELASKVDVYELTENGLAAQVSINGFKYWPDDELNRE